MIQINKIAAFIFLSLLLLNAKAQECGYMLSRYYSLNEHNAGIQNWSIVEDDRGVMYFGNLMGVLEYDSENWNTYPVNNGSAVRSLAKSKSGVVYVGAYAEFGYMTVNSKGQTYYKSLMPLVDSQYTDFKDVWCIHCLGDTVFFMSDKCIFRLVDGCFSYFPNSKSNYYLSFVVNGQYYVQELSRGLLKLQNDSLVMVSSNHFYANKNIHNIFPYNDGYLIGTRDEGFFIADSNFNPTPISSISSKADRVNQYFKKYNYYHGIRLPNGNLALTSVMDEILIVDPNWNVVDIIDKQTKQDDSEALYMYLQNNNLLWIGLGSGICQVEVMSELRYWNKDLGVMGILSDVAKNDHYFYVSTKRGLFYLDNNRNYFDFSHFKQIDGKFETANMFLRFWVPNSKKRILLLASATGIYQIDGTRAKCVLKCRNAKNLYQLSSDSLVVMASTTNGVITMMYQKGEWVEKNLNLNINDNVFDVKNFDNGDVWITTKVDGAYRIKNFSVEKAEQEVVNYGAELGYPQWSEVSFGDSTFFYADSNYIYLFNDSLNRFVLQNNHTVEYVPREQYVTNTIDGLSYLSMERLSSNIISNLCYCADDTSDYTWYSTADGLMRFSKNYFAGTGKLPKTLIRKVQTSDSVIFFGSNPIKINDVYVVDTSAAVNIKPVLGYKDNSLSFSFACPFYERENKVEYSCMLKGFDNCWSDWSTSPIKEYTNLNSGTYTFMVRARHLTYFVSEPSEFTFTVLPPFYATIWAYIVYAIFLFVMVVFVVRINSLRLIRKNDKLEKLVSIRTHELQIQKEEILVQKEELLVQAENEREMNDRLLAKNDELNEQKVALEIKTNELELSNATKNRFFRIIAHDLRNPISTFVISTKFLLSDFDSFDREKTYLMIHELNKLSHNTYDLLENLLDWAASQMGSIQCKPKLLELNALIAENLDLLESKLISKNIGTKVKMPQKVSVFADENMLNTVIRNILTNATKFTHDNGRISIETEFDPVYCYLSITDNGIGMSEETISNLFRIDSHCISIGTHNEKGTGLGLLLSKEFMDRMGGSIKVTSVLGAGSTFTLLIRLNG